MLTLPVYVQSLRQDVRLLRIHNALLLRSAKTNRGTITTLKEEIRKLKKEQEQLKKEQERLQKEKDRLQKEIEKLTKTTNRYRASLFDHGNFIHPEESEKKSKGGQLGHADTNREHQEDPASYTRHRMSASSCATCGTHLPRVNAVKQKVLLDIVLNPQVVKLLVESERQWCRTCKKEVHAPHEQSLPFTEYGINTFMMTLLLRYRCLLPLSKIAMVLSIGYGLEISESGVGSLFRQARDWLGETYDVLKQIVRKGELMYNDETGWRVRNTGAWMWIMANEQATVYVAAESRGKGIATEIYGTSHAYSMHDGLGSYATAIPPDKHLYCWAHLLRFCFEETIGKSPQENSVHIRDALVAVYHLQKHPKYQDHPKELEQEATRCIRRLLRQKAQDVTSRNLLHRLTQQRDGLIRALIVSPNGTNNFAEQELRPIALARKISYGSDTYTGMETTAILASVVQTYVRTKREAFFPELASALRAGVVNS